MTTTNIVTLQQKNGTSSEWVNANPVLLAGEIGYETDTKKIKIGTGIDAWNDLSYPTTVELNGLATVATTGSYNDLTDKPTIPTDIATSAQGTLADSAVQPSDLSTVATTGSYNDLTNKPTIPVQEAPEDNNQYVRKNGDWSILEINTTDATTTAINMSPLTTNMAPGDTQQLTIVYTPSYATDRSVSFSSSNDSIASVNTDGLVTAVADGSANITATLDTNNSITGIAYVTIAAGIIQVTSIVATPDTASMTIGDELVITTVIEPANSTNKLVSWSSSNDDIATVDDAGLVSGIGVGTALITASIEGVSDVTSCVVSASAILPTNILFDRISGNPSRLQEGVTYTAEYVISPTNATDNGATLIVIDADSNDVTNTAIVQQSYRLTNTGGEIDFVFQAGTTATDYTLRVTTTSGNQQSAHQK